ncbi:MAG: peptidylprolyl isomerase [Desulfosarcina sp.]|nr:peptidylprolyl isomerase [Desulfobacterales bacterium]
MEILNLKKQSVSGGCEIFWQILLLCLLLLLLFLWGCAPSLSGLNKENRTPETTLLQNDIIAAIGNKNITFKEFEYGFNSLKPEMREGLTEISQKENFLNDLVFKYLFASEAVFKKIDAESNISYTVKSIENSILAGEYMNRYVKTPIDASDEETEDYYNLHINDYTVTSFVTASHILIKPESAAPESWKQALLKAEKIRKGLKNKADFKATAAKFSHDSKTASKGGLMWNFNKQNCPQGFPKEVFTIKTGQISSPLKGADGYHIILVKYRRDEGYKPFEQVKTQIIKKVKRAKQDAIIAKEKERLYKKYMVSINKDLLQKIAVNKFVPAPVKKKPG